MSAAYAAAAAAQRTRGLLLSGKAAAWLPRANAGLRTRRRPAWRLAVAALVLAASPVWAALWGGADNYVNITAARVEQLSNAVRVVLESDGRLETDIDIFSFWRRNRETGWSQRDLKRFPLRLLNARSQIGRFVDIGAYPASHLTLSVPTDAREGVGLEMALHLYAPARLGRFQYRDYVADWSWRVAGDESLHVDMVLSDNKRELIITVHTNEHHDVAVATPAAGPRVEQDVRVDPADTGLRLWALRAPLQAVMDEIAAAAHVSISLGPGIDRRLTANLPPLPVGRLLALVARMCCLSLVVADGGYLLTGSGGADVGSYWAAENRRIHLRNISVDDALLLLPTFVLGRLRVDVESNALVAYGPPELLDKISADLRAVDRRGWQVVMRLMLVEVRDSRLLQQQLATLLEAGTTGLEMTPVDGSVRVAVADHSLNHVRLALQALEHRQAVRTDVRPHVTVLSGREARIFVGKQQFYRFMRRTWWGGTRLELNRVDVGVQLTATPWTGDGRSITVPFTVSADSILSRDSEGLPLVGRQQADGVLRVRRGQTIVFGGLRTRDSSVLDLRAPGLGALPPLARPGGTRTADRSGSELLICLSAEATQGPVDRPVPAPAVPLPAPDETPDADPDTVR